MSLTERMIRLLYPSSTQVSEAALMLWAQAAYDKHETSERAETLLDAIEILEDIGHITAVTEDKWGLSGTREPRR